MTYLKMIMLLLLSVGLSLSEATATPTNLAANTSVSASHQSATAPSYLAQFVNDQCAPSTPWKVTIYNGVGHNVWDRTYSLNGMNASNISTEHDPFDQDIEQWLLTHTLQ